MTTFDLTNLAKCDRVAYRESGYRRDEWRLSTVDRTTKTQIILVNGLRYRIKDGRQIGGQFSFGCDLADPGHPKVAETLIFDALKELRCGLHALERKSPKTVAEVKELVGNLQMAIDLCQLQIAKAEEL